MRNVFEFQNQLVAQHCPYLEFLVLDELYARRRCQGVDAQKRS